MLSRRDFVMTAGSLLILSSGAGRALSAPQTPEEVIRTLGGELLQMLTDRTRPAYQREDEFRRLFVRGVDMELVSRFVLGRYWREASDSERDEYRKLFEDFVVKSYWQRLAGYTGETFSVRDSRRIDDRDTLVSSVIERRNNQAFRVDWRLRRYEQDYRIIDVMIEGISMAVTQREEFTAVINKNGGKVTELNNILRQRIASLN